MGMVKIVRLNDGLDLIGEIEDIPNITRIKYPMVVYLDYEEEEPELIMQQWLPIDLVTDTEVVLNDKDVLCSFTPTAALIEYYNTNIEMMYKTIHKRNFVNDNLDMDQNSITEILEAFDETKLYTTKH